MLEVLVNRLGGLSLPGKSVVRLTDRPDMTFDVYRGRKTDIFEYSLIAMNMVWTHSLFICITIFQLLKLLNLKVNFLAPENLL